MLKISTVMFSIATLHFGVVFYRDWIAFRGKLPLEEPPSIFLARVDVWHRVMQDMLFVIQETLGAAAAVCTTSEALMGYLVVLSRFRFTVHGYFGIGIGGSFLCSLLDF